MEAIIIAPKTTPKEKLTQISSYGPKVILVEGDYSNSYNLAEKLSKDFGYVNLTTTFINPYGTDALKTVAYELDEQLNGEIPDYILIPVGSGPLLKGLYQGYMEILDQVKKVNGKMPKLIAVQADGCAPIVEAYDLGLERVNAWGMPNTIASGISDPLKGYEKDGTYTLQMVRKSNGLAISVTDSEIREAMKSLAKKEAIFAEPTGASTFAALKKLITNRMIDSDSTVICMVTGYGFKDMKVYFEMIDAFSYLDDPNDYDSICKVILPEEISRSN
jgi:threonine synthase